MADNKENKGNIDKEKLDKLKKERDKETGIPVENEEDTSTVDKEKLDELKKQRDKQTGIPIENDHVSSDPNRTPRGDDRDEYVDQKPGYIDEFNKKKFNNDKKTQKPPKNSGKR